MKKVGVFSPKTDKEAHQPTISRLGLLNRQWLFLSTSSAPVAVRWRSIGACGRAITTSSTLHATTAFTRSGKTYFSITVV